MPRNHKKASRRPRWPALHIATILAWADEHHERTGRWPTTTSGSIHGTFGEEKWKNVDAALRGGSRGLPAGSSLARLFADQRGYRNPAAIPPLTVKLILRWADAHRQRTGKWPSSESGPIQGAAPGEIWSNVDQALRDGGRGLRAGSSVARLLAEHRRRRNKGALSPLTVEQILGWVDAFYERTGNSPNYTSGSIPGAAGETWASVNHALVEGGRGLPGGSSVPRLLGAHGRVRVTKYPPPLILKEVLAWADAHHQRTGRWPTGGSGPIHDAPGETWMAVDGALRRGYRGFPGGSSLARLLDRHRRSPSGRAGRSAKSR
jgi:hypothetical protein